MNAGQLGDGSTKKIPAVNVSNAEILRGKFATDIYVGEFHVLML